MPPAVCVQFPLTVNVSDVLVNVPELNVKLDTCSVPVTLTVPDDLLIFKFGSVLLPPPLLVIVWSPVVKKLIVPVPLFGQEPTVTFARGSIVPVSINRCVPESPSVSVPKATNVSPLPIATCVPPPPLPRRVKVLNVSDVLTSIACVAVGGPLKSVVPEL